MIPKIFKLHKDATVLDACESFVLYRFLALPIVDDQNRILGMVDINLFTEEIIHMNTRGELDQFFETIGYRYRDISNASPLAAFRYRFPWLLATIISGLTAAFIAGMFEITLSQSIVLAFFLTLLLGMGESVSIQSMTLALQISNIEQPAKRSIGKILVREIASTSLLGAGAGAITAVVIILWHGLVPEVFIVGLSIVLSVITSSVIGFSIPTLIHKYNRDPKVAAGPITLAIADIFTILIYLLFASIVLR